MAYENYIKFKCTCSRKKLYWNTATLMCLCVAYVCFHETTEVVVTTETAWPTIPNIFTTWLIMDKICQTVN